VILFGLIVTAMIAGPALERRALALEGVVVSSITDCQPVNRHRCTSTYILRTPTNDMVTHEAGYGGSNLPMRLPVGTKILKKSGEFSYRIDDRIVDDDPSPLVFLFYGLPLLLFAVGVWLLVWGDSPLVRGIG